MSAVGHCGNKLACEGFFGLLKRERVAHQSYRTRDEARGIHSIISSGFITRECVAEALGKIGSFHFFSNRPWKWASPLLNSTKVQLSTCANCNKQR